MKQSLSQIKHNKSLLVMKCWYPSTIDMIFNLNVQKFTVYNCRYTKDKSTRKISSYVKKDKSFSRYCVVT